MNLGQRNPRNARNGMDRRRFLAVSLGLPLSAWLLQGCGGGKGSILSPGGGAGAGGGSLGLTRVPVQISHGGAADVLPPYTSLSAATAFSAATTAAGSSGETTVAAPGDGSSLAFVTDAAGQVFYFGWVSPTRTVLNAATTAEVLLYYALAAYLIPGDLQERVRDILAGSDSVRNRLAPAIEAFLRNNPTRLNGDTSALMTAVLAEAESLLIQIADPTARSRASNIENPGKRSGLETVQAPEPNTVYVQNDRIRRAIMVVNKLDENGNNPVQVSIAEIPAPKAFDSFANTVSGYIEAYYGNQTFGDGTTNAGFFSSVSDKVALPLSPADAEKTKYRVVVLQAGGLPGNEAVFSALLPAQQEYLRGFNLKNIEIRTLLEDILAPFLFAFVSKKVAGDKDLIESFAGDLFTALKDSFPGLLEQVAAGQKTAWAAFQEVAKTLTVNPSTGVTSPTFRKLIGAAAQAIVSRYTDLAGSIGPELFVSNVSQGLLIGGVPVPGVGRLLAILEGIDKGLDYGSRSRLITDVLTSTEVEYWDVTTVPSKVTITPDKTSVLPGDKVTFTAKVSDADPNAGPITYHWTLVGKGTLTNPINGATGTTLDTSGASVVFQEASDAKNGETGSLQVEAFVGGINNGSRFSVGKSTAAITVEELNITGHWTITGYFFDLDYNLSDSGGANSQISGTLTIKGYETAPITGTREGRNVTISYPLQVVQQNTVTVLLTLTDNDHMSGYGTNSQSSGRENVTLTRISRSRAASPPTRRAKRGTGILVGGPPAVWEPL